MRDFFELNWPAEALERPTIFYDERSGRPLLKKLKAKIAGVLHDFGLPGSYGRYYRDEHGSWQEDALGRTVIIVKSFPISAEPDFELSREDSVPLHRVAERMGCLPHLAALIAQHLFLLEVHRMVEDGDGAERRSFVIGQLAMELTCRLEWGSDVVAGRKLINNLAEARRHGARKRASQAAEWKELARRAAADIWRERPSLTTSAVAQSVRKKLTSSPIALPTTDRAIRDAISDLKPQKVGTGL